MRLATLLTRLLRKLRPMAPQQQGSPVIQQPTAERPRTPWTTIHINFADGTHRAHVFNRRYLTGEDLHRIIDVLLDEMEGAHFAGPVDVYRCKTDGVMENETVGLLPIDD